MIENEKRQLLIILLVEFLSFIRASIAYPTIPPLFLQPTGFHMIPLEWGDTFYTKAKAKL